MSVAGLYVHVPFRRARRSYDDSDYVVAAQPNVGRYVTALRRELRSYVQPHAAEEPITTLYVGGGRPSLLPLSTARSIVLTLQEVIDVSALEEVTVEVSPSDASPRLLGTLRQLGVDRLSLPVLSFSPAVLDAVGAPHSADDARRALDAARRAGFTTYSVDLLFGVPEQSLSTWTSTLQHAVDDNTPHITIMEAPTGAHGQGETARADQLEYAMRVLETDGYEQYELTHFARPGHRSRHQDTYYAHGNYLGVGPSAESFWWPDRAGGGHARRWANVSDVGHYADLLDRRHPPAAYRQTLPRSTLAREYILLRLRTNGGLDLDHLNAQYNVDLRTEKAALLDRLRADGLIQDDPEHVRLTPRGRLLTDAITTKLLPA
jgi:oxygen-independent coproporphyrinogen-3 oxidase